MSGIDALVKSISMSMKEDARTSAAWTRACENLKMGVDSKNTEQMEHALATITFLAVKNHGPEFDIRKFQQNITLLTNAACQEAGFPMKNTVFIDQNSEPYKKVIGGVKHAIESAVSSLEQAQAAPVPVSRNDSNVDFTRRVAEQKNQSQKISPGPNVISDNEFNRMLNSVPFARKAWDAIKKLDGVTQSTSSTIEAATKALNTQKKLLAQLKAAVPGIENSKAFEARESTIENKNNHINELSSKHAENQRMAQSAVNEATLEGKKNFEKENPFLASVLNKRK